MPHLCAWFKESLEQELERSWTTHELWFHQPSVPSTSVHRTWRAGFKILDATGGPQQRNSHWKLLISKLALSPFCFKSSHISNCLASVFTFLSRLTWLHPWLHPWWPRSNWKRYPFGATRPFTRAHQVARSLEVVEPKPPGSTTWGFLSLPAKWWSLSLTQRLTSNNLQIKVRVTSDLNHLQGGQFVYKSIFITFQDPRNYTKFYLMKLVGSWNCLDAPKRSWTKKVDNVLIII